MFFQRRRVLAVLFSGCLAGQAWSGSHEPVILTVTGLDDIVEYTLSDLEVV